MFRAGFEEILGNIQAEARQFVSYQKKTCNAQEICVAASCLDTGFARLRVKSGLE